MIYIEKTLENQIRRASAEAYPNECCGVLLGEIDGEGIKRLHSIEPVINFSDENEQYHRFLITPEDLLKSELKARSLKLDVLGFYHSHPDSAAKPSDYDKEHALPFYSYIITAVNNGVSGDFTCWEMSENRENFNSEKIIQEE